MSPQTKTASIILVEDNAADVFLIERALQEKGIKFELKCFDNGEEALKKLLERRLRPPDIILLDLNLPTIDGIGVLKAIRSMPRLADVPIAILTSSESPADKHRTAMLGAARFIKKPLKLDDFLREVGGGVEQLLTENGSRL